MLSSIIDTVIGVIAGFISIFISHAILAPRMEISTDIREYWSANSKRYLYSFRLHKKGFIDLIDVRIQCRLYIPNAGRNNSRLWDIYRIQTSTNDVIIFPRKPLRVFLKLYEFWADAPIKHPFLANNTRIGITEAGIRLEDFFNSFDDAYIIVNIIGSDRFTGVVKVFRSAKYRMRDIRFGEWEGMMVKEKAASASPPQHR